jgi:DNA polymerase III epsilon subunit-like protein
MSVSDLNTRHIALVDIETTGFDANKQEIIEIGLVVFDQNTFEIKKELNLKVKPEHIESADPETIKWEGWPYNERDWADAIPLADAMKQFVEATNGTLFCSQNPAAIDWPFINEACKKTGLKHTMDYHLLDTFSIGWAKLRNTNKLKKYNLKSLAEYFHIEPEPHPHRAINGARVAYEVYKKLMGEV